MKTIAITMDEATLARLDRALGAGKPGARASRSALVRRAVQEHLDRVAQSDREQGERAILAKHRARLARQARALMSDQAKP